MKDGDNLLVTRFIYSSRPASLRLLISLRKLIAKLITSLAKISIKVNVFRFHAECNINSLPKLNKPSLQEPFINGL